MSDDTLPPDTQSITFTQTVDLAGPEPLPSPSPAAVYLARLAAGSRPTIRAALETIASIASNGTVPADRFPWHKLRYQHTQAIRAVLADGRLSVATANHRLTALRCVLKEALRLDQISDRDYRKAIDLDPVRGVTLPAGRSLSADELARLFGVCAADPTPAGARDGAILALLYLNGLRRDEAVIIFFRVTDNGFLKRGHTIRRRVFDFAAGQLCRRGKDGADGRFILRLADAEMNDRFTAFAQ